MPIININNCKNLKYKFVISLIINMVLTKVEGIEIIAEYLKVRHKRRIRLKDFVKRARKKNG